MKSNMIHSFSQVPHANAPRSTFDRSMTHKTTFNGGLLIPIYSDEMYPGDTFNLNATFFARLATPIAPFMDNLVFESQFFAVPLRLLWNNFKRFMGEQKNPTDSTDFLVPQIQAVNSTVESIHDYLGIPPRKVSDEFFPNISAFWHRAYNLTWNEWYRDQNLQDSVPVDLSDGPDSTTYTLLRRGKRHDYFTSALPWPQKGPGVELPLGQSAPLVFDTSVVTPTGVYEASSKDPSTSNPLRSVAPGGLFNAGGSIALQADITPHTYADLTDATAATINQLRQAFQLQKFYERDARGGTRYTEVVRAHFGVTSPDARQQRPEYIGGGRQFVNVHPIAQTSATDSTTPQGNLAAMGTMSASNHGFTYSATEHCVILGLISVRADLTYQQGINRMFFRRTRTDFMWPVFSHIGEQVIWNKEIYVHGPEGSDPIPIQEQAFGYQERYAELRYKPSMITGKFRSGVDGSLDVWHLSQNFETMPALNEEFIQEFPPIDRVIAVPSEPQFLLDSYFSIRATRELPVFGVPGLIDHF